MRDTGDAPEDGPERAAQNVRRFAFGKVDRLPCYEGESQRMEPEEQVFIVDSAFAMIVNAAAERQIEDLLGAGGDGHVWLGGVSSTAKYREMALG